MSAVELIFWASAGLLVYTQLGYPLALLALARLTPDRPQAAAAGPALGVSLIVAAHNEESVIAAKVA
ncbi:MAG TPA: hypothetical protein VHM72_06990, partial [Solirubrobacteraceae bacterium]|nr:hypothetical protein [Solirubrobacteraceae bacterium]